MVGIDCKLVSSVSMNYVAHFAPFKWVKRWYEGATANRNSTVSIRLGLANYSALQDKESVLAFAKEVNRIRSLAATAVEDCDQAIRSLGVVWPQWASEWRQDHANAR